MRRHTFLIIIPVFALAVSCSNSDARSNDEPSDTPASVRLGDIDRTFIEHAAASGRTEVEHGRIAVDRAASEAVKQYASHLVDAHTAANNELAGIAVKHNITVDAPPVPDDRRGDVQEKNDATTTTKTGAMSPGKLNPTGTHGAAGTLETTGQALDRQRAGIPEPWMQLSGEAFDRAFIAAQVKAHHEAIALFGQEISIGADPELKAFADKQLPALRDHLKKAEELQRTLCSKGC